MHHEHAEIASESTSLISGIYQQKQAKKKKKKNERKAKM